MIDWPWTPEPDSNRLLDAIYRRGDPGWVPFLELFADRKVIAAALDEPYLFEGTSPAGREQWEIAIDQTVRFWHILGYDAIWQGPVWVSMGCCC